jgi:1-deoxy-D-xylulose-5-phosphate reductoisomerase
VAVVGGGGIMPTMEAIKRKKQVALATKEVMVMGGELVVDAAKKYGVSIIPIDSETSAVFQSLRTGEKKEIKRLILTMGKGKIARMRDKEFSHITIEDVFGGGHWKMGDKITVDSATCVNKAFEVIEARYFFDIPGSKITVTVHPEYICHSMVEFNDGSIVGEFGTSDMRRYIQHALFYPERKANDLGTNIIGKSMSFEEAPYKRFPCLTLGHEVLRLGGTAGAVFHGSDRAAVELFLAKKIGFLQIYEIIEGVLKRTKIVKKPNLEQIFQAEEEAYELACKLFGSQ